MPTGDLERAGSPRGFLTTAGEVCDAMDQYLRDRRTRGTSDAKRIDGIRWKDAVQYENAWGKLARLDRRRRAGAKYLDGAPA